MSEVRQKQAHTVARVEDIPDGERMIVEVEGREFGVFNVGGEFYALPNNCLHQNGPLCRGPIDGTLIAGAETDWKPVWTLEGEIVRCPWHAMEYHLTTGRCLSDPRRRLRLVEVSVEDGEVRILL